MGKRSSQDYGIKWKCNLRVYRARDNRSQEEIAELLGITRQTVSGIENGRYNPSLVLAYKLAELFDVTIDEMFSFSKKE